ncbi:RDD family protein [Ilumatobacter sp.]|uniref:RDD family protein n=1 Tax=Ilumatobacter sp. TaxID=1967498 RepID=UPI003B51E4BE
MRDRVEPDTERRHLPEPGLFPDPARPSWTDPSAEPAPGVPVDDTDLDDLVERLVELGDDDHLADVEVDGRTAVGGGASRGPRPDRPRRSADRPTREVRDLESSGGLHFRPRFASFTRRGLALVVETVAVAVAIAPGAYVGTLGSAPVIVAGFVVAALGFALLTAVAARSIASRGCWIGHRLTGTRVVSVLDGSRLDVSHAAARFAVRQLISPVFLFGFVAALVDPQRRAFHDQVAGSVVVARPRRTWTHDETDTTDTTDANVAPDPPETPNPAPVDDRAERDGRLGRTETLPPPPPGGTPAHPPSAPDHDAG